jgi:hypothetical protein
MKQPSRITKVLLKVILAPLAYTIGVADRYTKEHRKFLSSGFVCQNCKETLLTKWWVADVNCYDSNGDTIPIMKLRLKARFFECPKCFHRWPFRKGHQVPTAKSPG